MKTSSFTRFIAALGLFAQSAVTLHAGTLQSASPTASDRFGMDVSNVGSLGVVITSPTSAVGSAGYVFNSLNSNNTITPDKTLLRNDGSAGAFYLLSASMSGNNALLSGSVNNAGAAYLYRNIDAAGTIQNQQAKLVSNAPQVDNFGEDTSLDGDLALVSARGLTYVPRAYVFRNMSTATGTILPSTRLEITKNEPFGGTVSLSGTTGLVSGLQAAYLFRGLNTAGAVMNPTAELPLPVGGWSGSYPLSISGSVALVANPGQNDSSGIVYVYPFLNSATGTVSPTYTLTAGTTGDTFGWSVSLNGGTGLIGSPSRSSSRGSVYLFNNFGGGNPVHMMEIYPSQGVNGDFFGGKVNLQGDNFIVGSVGANASAGKAYSGRVSSFTTLDVNGAFRPTAGLSFTSRVDWIIGNATDGNFAEVSAGDTAVLTHVSNYVYIGKNSGSDNNQLTVKGTLSANRINIGSTSGNTNNELRIENGATLNNSTISLAPGDNKIVIYGNHTPYSALSTYLKLNQGRVLRVRNGNSWLNVTSGNADSWLSITYNPSTNYTTVAQIGQNTVYWNNERVTQLAVNSFYNDAVGQFDSIPAVNGQTVWSNSLQANVNHTGSGFFSPQFGSLTAGSDKQWTLSGFFGWTHYGSSDSQYGGWVHTERFHWMKFVRNGNEVFLFVPMVNSWLSVNGDGSFFSFQWGQLTPQGLNRYQSSIFGGLTTGDFNGWVHSDRFGWMWANGDQTWYWSETRKEWLGVTAEGGIWSTEQKRFL